VSDQPTILLVDDDPDIADLLKVYLGSEGFSFLWAETGEALRETIAHEPVDLVLMDLMLPGEDGLSLTRELRNQSNIGIIMLTAKGDTVDRVVGLELGADDYIAKPFEKRELLARIRSVLRRAGQPAASETPAERDGNAVVRFAGWQLDLDARELTGDNGDTVDLTSSEFNLLAEFVNRPGRVQTRDYLLNAVHNRDWEAYDRSIDVLITRLRRKIEPNPKRPSIIKTVRGAGYIFAAKVEPVAAADT